MARRRKLRTRDRSAVARKKGRRPRPSHARGTVGRQELASTKRSLRKLVNTLELLTATSDAALRDTACVRTLIESEFERHLAVAAMKDNVFRDLALLDHALDADDTNHEELRRLRMAPAAVLRWISTFLHVEAHLEPGAEREVSAETVSKYDWRGDPAATDLMRIRVVAPGWKWRDRLLAKPLVEVV